MKMYQIGFAGLLLTSLLWRAAPIPTHSPKIVLITLDGVRYQDVLDGTDATLSQSPSIPSRNLLPNLYSNFVDNGITIGKYSEMEVSGPNYISLPGYLEILRGHPAKDCTINECIPHQDTSIIDYYHQWNPNSEIAVIASWEAIRYVGNTSSSYVVNIGRVNQNWTDLNLAYPATFSKDEREDVYTIAETNMYLSHHSPDFLWVSLGDTDEYAHMGDYKRYIKSLQAADRFIGQLVRDMPSDTTFIITTDHGRGVDWRGHGGFDQSSKRVWMMMKGPSIPHKGMVDLGMPITSSWIYPTIKGIIDRDVPDNSILGLVK